MSQVTREGGTVGVERVPKLGWKTNTQCCFVGALASALARTEHPVGERDLSGLTALAFRTRWLYYEDKPRWCPSCPVGECHEEFAAVGRNTGWQLVHTMEGDRIGSDRFGDVVASIDRGIPAIVYDVKWNPAVAYGYADSGKKLIVSDYFGGDGPRDADSLPPFVATVASFTDAPDRKAAVLDALKMAVANWHTDHKFNGAAVYWYGKAAYDHWIEDVLHAQEAPDGSPFFATWWNMDVLCEARQQAALWLPEVAPLFNEPASGHLRAAAGIYAQEHDMLWRAWGEDNAFDGDPKKWAEEAHRRRMADVLSQAREAEGRAIAEMEAALVAAGNS